MQIEFQVYSSDTHSFIPSGLPQVLPLPPKNMTFAEMAIMPIANETVPKATFIQNLHSDFGSASTTSMSFKKNKKKELKTMRNTPPLTPSLELEQSDTEY